MSVSAEADAHMLRRHLRDQLEQCSTLADSPALSCNAALGVHLHLAVMTGPFLDLVVTGAKVIESRFHRVRQAPLFAAAAGDVIAFKQASGPVRAMAVVSDVEFVDLGRTPIESVRDRFQEGVAATDDDFWSSRADAKWASLLSIGQVREVPPVAITKRDRRAWIRYTPRCATCSGDRAQPHPTLGL